jgi:hypothetical protein
MAKGAISLKAALKEMERYDDEGKAVPFQVRWVTLKGEVIECKKGILAKNSAKLNSFVKIEKGGQGIANKSIKAPNHSKNRTRNILFLESGEIRKVKIHLITSFNGKTVLL